VQWIRLRKKGKNPNRLRLGHRHFRGQGARSGRRLCGQEKAKDALSPRAHYRCGFTVCSLPAFSTLTVNPFAEALLDNTGRRFRSRSPSVSISDVALDLRRASAADHRVDGQGERTLDLAKQFGITPARISQMRRETHGRLAAVRRGLLMLCADRRGQTLSRLRPLLQAAGDGLFGMEGFCPCLQWR